MQTPLRFAPRLFCVPRNRFCATIIVTAYKDAHTDAPRIREASTSDAIEPPGLLYLLKLGKSPL